MSEVEVKSNRPKRRKAKMSVVKNHPYWRCDVKWCSLCVTYWPFDYFHKGRAHGCSSWCKRCSSEWRRKRFHKADREELLEKARARCRARYKKNPSQKLNYYKNKEKRIAMAEKWRKANMKRVREKSRERVAKFSNTHEGVLRLLYRSLRGRWMRGLPIPSWASFKVYWLAQPDFIAYAQFRIETRQLTPHKCKSISALYEHRRMFICTKVWSTNPCDYILTRPPRRGIVISRNVNAEGAIHAH